MRPTSPGCITCDWLGLSRPCKSQAQVALGRRLRLPTGEGLLSKCRGTETITAVVSASREEMPESVVSLHTYAPPSPGDRRVLQHLQRTYIDMRLL